MSVDRRARRVLGARSLLCLGLSAVFAGSGMAFEKREPGLNELVIIRPSAHEKGLPAVIYNEARQEIEIPPTLHVHRYYYSGDREFQGPVLSGGPTIVVARHPCTGEQMNIDVMLPPGAPVIAYNKYNITYVYEDKRVIIGFSRLMPKHAKIALVSGRGIRRTVRDTALKLVDHKREHKRRNPLTQSLRETVRGRVEMVKGAVGVTANAASFVVDKANQAVDLVPGAQYLKSLGQQSAERGATETVRQAGLEQADDARKFIRTLR